MPTGIKGNAGHLGLAGGVSLGKSSPERNWLTRLRCLLRFLEASWVITGFSGGLFGLIWFNSDAIDLHRGLFCPVLCLSCSLIFTFVWPSGLSTGP